MDYITTNTSMTEGEIDSEFRSNMGQQYVGPYPPSGTHEYEIRVYALKEAAEEDQSRFDSGNSKFEQVIAELDQNSSGAGNVLAYGTLSGTYTRES